MAPTRRANQDTSRIQEENNTLLSGACASPPNGPKPTINLTPEELTKIVTDVVKASMTKKASTHHSTHPEQELEQLQEEEKREEERDSSADSKTPTVAEELKEIRKKVRVLEGQVGSRSSTQIVEGCSFSNAIVREPLPRPFKSARIKDCDGSSDPEEHLARFENIAMLHCYGDQIKCKLFLTTLVDSAQRWFERLAPQSIHSFEDFQKIFLHQFSSSKKYKKTTFSLFEVKQGQDETLRAYIKRFNRVALDVPACAPETKTTAFMHESGPEPVRRPVPESHPSRDRSRKPPWLPRRPGPSAPRRTADIQSGSGREEGRSQEKRSMQTERKDPSPTRRLIKMILGGSTDSDSNRARKAKSRRDCLEIYGKVRNEPVICFGLEDLRGVSLPHNNAFVIQARVANYDVLRVFVDNGSSVNVIFKEALIQMDLHEYQLEAVETPLFGFVGHAVYTEGEIRMPLTL
ncbi:uncharacterized protein [Primulina eburnea]|uniref:uncharacterized protein n=1 Tax=Primulina eburnea TaxID=1245227 RepID=UPI003C6BE72F